MYTRHEEGMLTLYQPMTAFVVMVSHQCTYKIDDGSIHTYVSYMHCKQILQQTEVLRLAGKTRNSIYRPDSSLVREVVFGTVRVPLHLGLVLLKEFDVPEAGSNHCIKAWPSLYLWLEPETRIWSVR